MDVYCQGHVSYTAPAAMASRKFIGNFVAIDAIHQDRVRKELLAQKNWEKNHGYMIEEIKKVWLEREAVVDGLTLHSFRRKKN